MFWANSRSGNTEDMGLAEMGVRTINQRGQIEVDGPFRTSVEKHLWVAMSSGRRPAPAPSYDQGRPV